MVFYKENGDRSVLECIGARHLSFIHHEWRFFFCFFLVFVIVTFFLHCIAHHLYPVGWGYFVLYSYCLFPCRLVYERSNYYYSLMRPKNYYGCCMIEETMGYRSWTELCLYLGSYRFFPYCFAVFVFCILFDGLVFASINTVIIKVSRWCPP